jgi:adenine-specific DNA-methyltransferase
MKKLTAADSETKSADLVAENLARLKALFPELVTEGPEGAAVNLDVLKALVGDKTVTDADEKYGLNWHGKRRARQLALTPSTGTLRPCQAESEDWDSTKNLMIEGDNLEVLKLLHKSYAGKVKLIYIDPPYNTGKDFVYPDDFKDNIKNYMELTGQAEFGNKITSNTEASGRFHTDWLNMMYPRLRVARDLLRHDGVLAVSIDHHELTNLTCVLSDLFGGENVINTICWVNNLKGRQISAHGAALTHEYIVICGRDQSLVEEFSVQVDWAKSRMPSAYKGFNYEVLTDAKGEYVLKNQLYNTNSAFNEQTRPNLVFNIHFNPKTDEVRTTDVGDPQTFPGFHVIRPHPCSDGKHKYHAWRWSRQKIELERDDLAFIVSGDAVRVFTKVRGHASTVLKDLITDISTNEGQKDVERVLDSCPFPFPKPVALMRLLIQAVSTSSDGGAIMDFFAGSGTLGHAVMEQCSEDGIERPFVLVQLPEPLDPANKEQLAAADFCDLLGKPRTIAEITKERLRRAASHIKKENPTFAGDVGFRVFKLDSSNIRDWEPDREKLDETLRDHAEHLKTGRTEEDILYELLLKLGLDLCVPIETKLIAGKSVRSIGSGVLIACLATEITRDEVEPLTQGVIAWHKLLAPAGDTTCVFRDSAFVDDVAKTNLTQILSQHGLATVRSL